MATPQTMRLVDRKHELYDDLAGSDVPVPPYRVFRTLTEFDQAVFVLEGTSRRLCVKPSVGVYGAGFRILERSGCELKRILSGENIRTSIEAFRSALRISSQDTDMMLMAYLPGIERSIDILAQDGRMVRAVSRVKVGSHQILETDGPSITIAEMLTRRYGLNGVFRVSSV
ncbi:ATP-grasp domain-containing protein [Azospirillum ramasamyi]|uniref:ATP-grasp domain-containing protein n=1 Tax=Azospirillum ramasamyi TaxID=682998 RepID=UPI001FE2E7C1|nr:ATP-grasp domain-containing protein [Azospirillum ramasamyi]